MGQQGAGGSPLFQRELCRIAAPFTGGRVLIVIRPGNLAASILLAAAYLSFAHAMMQDGLPWLRRQIPFLAVLLLFVLPPMMLQAARCEYLVRSRAAAWKGSKAAEGAAKRALMCSAAMRGAAASAAGCASMLLAACALAAGGLGIDLSLLSAPATGAITGQALCILFGNIRHYNLLRRCLLRRPAGGGGRGRGMFKAGF